MSKSHSVSPQSFLSLGTMQKSQVLVNSSVWSLFHKSLTSDTLNSWWELNAWLVQHVVWKGILPMSDRATLQKSLVMTTPTY